MRISVRSRLPWRMISCPAAKGIRCVKPSSATVMPSCTVVATASARERKAVIGTLSQIEKHRLARALQYDVERVDCGTVRSATAVSKERVAPSGGHQGENRIGSVRRLVGKVEPRQQVVEQPTRKHRDTNMRRLLLCVV